ncbi:hypothetical protein J4Q44_G00222610 [Coregonus suidteri]|uniref:Homeobox protein Nkx-2.2a n=1 Tax=Coregonus suidteri TaxID=861788 RepID=A0AAN8QQM8_9TELE
MSLTNTKTGFSVKDILDLPDTNDEEGSITGPEEDNEGSETTKTTGVLVQSPLVNVQNLPIKNRFYDSSDNPYTRWLATTDTIQYSLHGLSASSQDSAKSPEPSADESPDNDKETSSNGSDSGKKRKRRVLFSKAQTLDSPSRRIAPRPFIKCNIMLSTAPPPRHNSLQHITWCKRNSGLGELVETDGAAI